MTDIPLFTKEEAEKMEAQQDSFAGERQLRTAVRLIRAANCLLVGVLGLFGYWLFRRFSEPLENSWPLLAALSLMGFSSAVAGRAHDYYIQYRDAQDASKM